MWCEFLHCKIDANVSMTLINANMFPMFPSTFLSTQKLRWSQSFRMESVELFGTTTWGFHSAPSWRRSVQLHRYFLVLGCMVVLRPLWKLIRSSPVGSRGEVIHKPHKVTSDAWPRVKALHTQRRSPNPAGFRKITLHQICPANIKAEYLWSPECQKINDPPENAHTSIFVEKF